MSRRVSVAYTVPIQVIVDLDTGYVDRVIVVDELIAQDRDGYSEDADTFQPVEPADRDRAYEIAESGTAWPSWDIGY